MRVTAPVTDYIRASVMNTKGDLFVRGTLVPERLTAGPDGHYFQGKGAGEIPGYTNKMPPLTTKGDLIARGTSAPERLPAGPDGYFLQGKGAGNIPEYSIQIAPMIAAGDMITRGVTVPARLGIGPLGNVLASRGVALTPKWKSLFDLLTTKGDIWVQGLDQPQKLAAGALNTYLKAKGAGELPIYEKLSLSDTGVHIGYANRDSAGDQVITGVDFKSSVIIFLSSDGIASEINYSVGFDDGSTHMCLRIIHDGSMKNLMLTDSINIESDASNRISGYITTVSADGFTISWTLVGSVSNHFIYLCLP